jgi:protein-disulfide isomerase
MKKYLSIIPLALGLVFAASAADDKGGTEPGITREQGEEILKELRQIRQLLEKGARPAAANEPAGALRVDLGEGPWLGKKDAPLTMVEYTDYQCTFCRRFNLATFPEIKKQYIDTGKLRFTSRDLPLEFHSNAFRAAQAARCAGDQGRFWEMRDQLIANASKLSSDDIGRYAQDLKLDMLQFRACMQSEKYAGTVRKDSADAEALGVTGTPSFVIGKSTPKGVSGELVVGALPLEEFEAKLKAAAQ